MCPRQVLSIWATSPGSPTPTPKKGRGIHSSEMIHLTENTEDTKIHNNDVNKSHNCSTQFYCDKSEPTMILGTFFKKDFMIRLFRSIPLHRTLPISFHVFYNPFHCYTNISLPHVSSGLIKMGVILAPHISQCSNSHNPLLVFRL